MNTETNAAELPWPKHGDQLFRPSTLVCGNAAIEADWEGYSYGYKAAADILVERSLADVGNIQDALVYPIVFLYRQYLELQLKKVIHDCQVYRGLSITSPAHHRFDELWKECQPMLAQAFPNTPREDFVRVHERLIEFSAIDPTSTAFRYPLNRFGQPSITGLDSLDLKNLMDVVDRLSAFLEACEEELGEMWAAKCDESFQEDERYHD